MPKTMANAPIRHRLHHQSLTNIDHKSPHKRASIRRSLQCRSSSSEPHTFEHYILDLQKDIIKTAEALDGSGLSFKHDRWERPNNQGYGITSVIEGGNILEKAAANISIIHGILSPERAKTMSSRGRESIDPAGGQSYSAQAMSLVFHSAHPHIPTLRADVRRFEVDGRAWYGGGCDLTPFYVNGGDFKEFHSYWKTLCDGYDGALYPEFKEWCDRYFYIPCRKEHRGIGGLFFDDLDAAANSYDVEEFVMAVGRGILPSWVNIVERNRSKEFTDQQRQWQLLRRGRYLEFNLLYDRGVKFGLDGGRIESIMVSAPPLIRWSYDVQPEPGSDEAQLVTLLQSPREWV